MSDMPPTGTPGEAGEQPSEEEIRAYLDQLRSAPVDQVIAEVCSALINAAQVKMGRPDARVLLDVVGAVAEQVRGRVDDGLVSQLDDALTQLRLAQVDAEKQAAGTGESADESAVAADADSPEQPEAPEPPPSTGKRLWTPGS